jgi:hypothetical protein
MAALGLSRAAHLLEARSRANLAKGLRRAVADARTTRPQFTAAVHVARPAVLACAPEILALAAELTDRDVSPAGVDMTRDLLADGSGPLYRARDEDELREAIEAIRAALGTAG